MSSSSTLSASVSRQASILLGHTCEAIGALILTPAAIAKIAEHLSKARHNVEATTTTTTATVDAAMLTTIEDVFLSSSLSSSSSSALSTHSSSSSALASGSFLLDGSGKKNNKTTATAADHEDPLTRLKTVVVNQWRVVAQDLSRIQSQHAVIPHLKMKNDIAKVVASLGTEKAEASRLAKRRTGSNTATSQGKKSASASAADGSPSTSTPIDYDHLIYAPDTEQIERLVMAFTALGLCQPFLWESILSAPSGLQMFCAEDEAEFEGGAALGGSDAQSLHQRGRKKFSSSLNAAASHQRLRMLFGPVVATVVPSIVSTMLTKTTAMAAEGQQYLNITASSRSPLSPPSSTALASSSSSTVAGDSTHQHQQHHTNSAATAAVSRQIQQDALLKGFLAARKGGNGSGGGGGGGMAVTDAKLHSPTATTAASPLAHSNSNAPSPLSMALASLMSTVSLLSHCSFGRVGGGVRAASAVGVPSAASPTTALTPNHQHDDLFSSPPTTVATTATNTKVFGAFPSSEGREYGATPSSSSSAATTDTHRHRHRQAAGGSDSLSPSAAAATSSVRVVVARAHSGEGGGGGGDPAAVIARPLFPACSSLSEHQQQQHAPHRSSSSSSFRLAPPPPLPPLVVDRENNTNNTHQHDEVCTSPTLPNISSRGGEETKGSASLTASTARLPATTQSISIVLSEKMSELLLRCLCGEPLSSIEPLSHPTNGTDGANSAATDDDSLFFSPTGSNTAGVVNRGKLFSASVVTASGTSRNATATRAYYESLFEGFGVHNKEERTTQQAGKKKMRRGAKADAEEDDDEDDVDGDDAATTNGHNSRNEADDNASSSSTSSSSLFINPMRIPWNTILTAMAGALREGKSKALAARRALVDEEERKKKEKEANEGGNDETAASRNRKRRRVVSPNNNASLLSSSSSPCSVPSVHHVLSNTPSWNPFLAHYCSGFARLHCEKDSTTEGGGGGGGGAAAAADADARMAKKKERREAKTEAKRSRRAEKEEAKKAKKNSLLLHPTLLAASYGAEEIPLPPPPSLNEPLCCLLCGKGCYGDDATAEAERESTNDSSRNRRNGHSKNKKKKSDDEDDTGNDDADDDDDSGDVDGSEGSDDDDDEATVEDLIGLSNSTKRQHVSQLNSTTNNNYRHTTANNSNNNASTAKPLKGLLRCCGCRRYIHPHCVYPTQRELTAENERHGFKCHGCRLKGSGGSAADVVVSTASNKTAKLSSSPPSPHWSSSCRRDYFDANALDPFTIRRGGEGCFTSLQF